MGSARRIGTWRRLTLALAAPLALVGCSAGGGSTFVWGRAPEFTPDGARVLFSQNLSSPTDTTTATVSVVDTGTIWRIDADGRNATQLTPSGRGPDFYPAVSPDGTRIAYVTNEQRQFDLAVMNLDGTDRRKITEDLVADTWPTWSPDGQWIVFVSDRTGNYDLWRVHPDGSGLQQLSTFPADESSPAYSPNGQWIAFTSNMDRGNFDIWVMDADGGNLRQLTRKDNPASSIADGSPDWSADSTRLVFERWLGNWDIWSINADGTGLIQLTNDDEHDGDPTFSPNGQTVAFTSGRSGWWQIWLMNPDGSNPRQLTDAPPQN